MRTLLCCIGRKENQYIREFVEYYKTLGFTHIRLYDNNFDGEDDFHDVIGDYIDDGYVTVVDYRNRNICQVQAYEECYAELKNDYDWFAFFDCDEFLTFVNPDIKTIDLALSDSRFDNYDLIHINWMMYDDNDLVKNDGRPVLERFTRPMTPFTKKTWHMMYSENNFIKSIVRGGLPDIRFKSSVTPINVDKCCDPEGNKTNGAFPVNHINYNYMYLRHFSDKTTEEFINKMERGFPDQPHRIPNFIFFFNSRFFRMNEPTKEKLDYIKERTGVDLFRFYPHLINEQTEK